MESNDWLAEQIERLFPEDILDTLDRDRPYNGQPWTDQGERGKQEVHGITMRDLRDCFIRGCYDSAPIEAKDYPKSVHDLPWEDIDIIAVVQNMVCWVEKYMGIFPNTPKLIDIWEHIPIINLDDEDSAK